MRHRSCKGTEPATGELVALDGGQGATISITSLGEVAVVDISQVVADAAVGVDELSPLCDAAARHELALDEQVPPA